MASSLDTVGHITKTVKDSARYLQVVAGYDRYDATSINSEVPDYLRGIDKGIKGLKIGVPKEFFGKGLNDEVSVSIGKVIKDYENLGAEIVEISFPHVKYANECYYIIMSAEVSSNLARYDGVRYGHPREAFASEARRRIMLGTHVLSAGYHDAYYKKAKKVQALLMSDFATSWSKVDVIISPVSPTPPWKLGEKVSDPLAMYLSDIYTVTANLVGIPALAMPAGFINGLPVGFQIMGPHLSEVLLFKTGYAYEQIRPWYLQKPPLEVTSS